MNETTINQKMFVGISAIGGALAVAAIYHLVFKKEISTKSTGLIFTAIIAGIGTGIYANKVSKKIGTGSL